jgi:hypothetical protein
MSSRTALLLAFLLVVPSTASAIVSGQVDDFENGTTMGWSEGALSSNPPQNISTGGPAGLGDNYLQNVSSGLATSGGKMTMFNQAQWTGDYTTAGVAGIQVSMANFGTTALFMRIAIEGSATEFGSTAAFPLPADGVWRTALFRLGPGDMSLIAGVASLGTVLSGVTNFRIISRAGGPGWQGDQVNGVLGVDNIRALTTSGVGDPVLSQIRLLPNEPNPLSSATVIRYELALPSPVEIEIFDLAGRSLRVLESSPEKSAGRHEVVWDGLTDEGQSVPSGVYFYRLRSGSVIESRKMVVVRN